MTLEPIRDALQAGAPLAPGRDASRPVVSRFARALEAATDPEGLERLLLEMALDPAEGMADRAWMLVASGSGRLTIGRELASFVPGDAQADPGAPAPASEWDPLAAGEPVASAWRGDLAEWCDRPAGDSPWSGMSAVAAVKLRGPRGMDRVLVVGWLRDRPGCRERFGSFAERARLAARALEAREGWRSSAQQGEALAGWLRAVADAHHVNEGLRAGGRAALRVSGSGLVAIWTAAAARPPLLAHTGGEARDRESIARALQSWANEVVERGTPRVVEPVEEATRESAGAPPTLWPAVLERVRRARLFPLIASGQVHGVLAAVDLVQPGPAAELPLESESTPPLVAVAGGIAMLLDRAASTEARREAEQLAGELRARLRRLERSASVGDRAARALHDASPALASIGAFARRIQRELGDDDPRREYLEVILRESERLEARLEESAEPVEPEPSRLALESVNAVIQDVLPGVGEKLVRRRVRLLKRLDPDAPALLLDGARIRQVFRNVIERAVDSVAVGGRVRVESRLVRDHVIAEIAFDGGHSPGDLLEELFVPFTPGAAHGAPGLGVADRVIRQHGGEVRVRADGEWGAAVLITLPVRGNEERRRSRADRRAARTDRRDGAETRPRV